MVWPHTVTVIKPGGRDSWGNSTADGASTSYSGCFWQPVSSTEQQQANNVVRVVARVFMPPTADVAADDRISFGGETYAIEGRPALHSTLAGPHHYEVELTDVEG